APQRGDLRREPTPRRRVVAHDQDASHEFRTPSDVHTSRKASTMRSTLYVASAWVRAAAPMPAAASGSFRSLAMVPASAVASRGGTRYPVSPCSMISVTPPTAVRSEEHTSELQ